VRNLWYLAALLIDGVAVWATYQALT